MPKEIERKFLVSTFDYRKLAKPVTIVQGFLSLDKERVVRLRIKSDKAFLTIKTSTQGITRKEYDYLIPQEHARELLEEACLKPLIRKYRYSVPFEGFIWEIDEFLDENQGLVLAEIELEEENQSFLKPDWIGQEVTNDQRYYNINLVKKPYNCWT